MTTDRDLAYAVLNWAKTPGPHGGNPYTLEMVRMAEAIVAEPPERTWDDYKQSMRDEIREAVNNEYIDIDDADDSLHEYVDSAVPIYTHDILRLAADNWDLILVTSDLAADGQAEPVKHIQYNMYDELYAVAVETIDELKDERDEAMIDAYLAHQEAEEAEMNA